MIFFVLINSDGWGILNLLGQNNFWLRRLDFEPTSTGINEHLLRRQVRYFGR